MSYCYYLRYTYHLGKRYFMYCTLQTSATNKFLNGALDNYTI